MQIKIVTGNFFEIELRSILFSIELWSARLPTLRYLLLNMNKQMQYLSFFFSLRASRMLVEYTVKQGWAPKITSIINYSFIYNYSE